jgi:hypothetical protein
MAQKMLGFLFIRGFRDGAWDRKRQTSIRLGQESREAASIPGDNGGGWYGMGRVIR